MEEMHSLSDIRKLVEGEEECDIIMDEQTKHDPQGSGGDPTESREPAANDIPIEDNEECESVRPSEEDDVGDIITARDVVNALYEPDEDVSIRVFPDRKNEDDFPGKIVPTKAAKLANIEDWLKSQNFLNRGVFFMVNKGIDNDESVTRVNAQFVDMDNDSFEEQRKKVDAFPLSPSMVIQTSKSLHVYWFLRDTGEDAGLALYRPIQIALVKHFDGDIKCQNESRVMRLPGYYHCKKEPVLVRCVRFHPERRYSQAEIANALPEYVEPGQKDEIKVLPAESDGRRGVHVVEAGCDFIQYCRDNASTLSEPLWYAMITNLAGFQGGKEAIHRLSEGYTEYTPDETDKKIEHYFKSKTRPMTCKTIAEAGFECPRKADGSCKCHSPAKRADEPLADDVLLDMIKGLPVSADPLESLKSVKDFVEDYLYNVNPVNATALLSHPMKEHMRLTVADTRPLITYQKQLYKEHEKRIAEEKIQYQASKLPDWYDFNLNGTLKFMPDILAKYMVEEEDVFFSAEEYRRYEDGVYQTISDLEAQNMVRDLMLLGETKLSQIKDAEGQWRMQCVKDLRELNPNPYVINLRNGLLNVLDSTMAAHTPKYLSTYEGWQYLSGLFSYS